MNTEHHPESVENFIEGLATKLLDEIHNEDTLVASIETDVDVEARHGKDGLAKSFIKRGEHVSLRLESPEATWRIERETR